MDIGDAISSAVASALPPQQDIAVADDADDTLDQPTDDTTLASDDADPAPVEMPEGYVAVATVTDALATEFTLRDAEGEVEVPDLMVEYKANGKVRQGPLGSSGQAGPVGRVQPRAGTEGAAGREAGAAGRIRAGTVGDVAVGA